MWNGATSHTKCKIRKFSDLKWWTLSDVFRGHDNDCTSGDYIIFTTNDDQRYIMYHDRDCCESVTIDDIVGDLSDLLGSQVLHASVDSNEDEEDGDHETWTFYNIRTLKGGVTIRWYGTSNGYYSESVDFRRLGSDNMPVIFET